MSKAILENHFLDPSPTQMIQQSQKQRMENFASQLVLKRAVLENHISSSTWEEGAFHGAIQM